MNILSYLPAFSFANQTLEFTFNRDKSPQIYSAVGISKKLKFSLPIGATLQGKSQIQNTSCFKTTGDTIMLFDNSLGSATQEYIFDSYQFFNDYLDAGTCMAWTTNTPIPVLIFF